MQQDKSFRDELKIGILCALNTDISVLRSQVAYAIGALAKIEIPRGEWLDLIPNLCSNAYHEDIKIKIASIQTLHAICEDLSLNDIDDLQKSNIIQAITVNINKSNEEVSKYAMKALN